jgi:hypothetical protein
MLTSVFHPSQIAAILLLSLILLLGILSSIMNIIIPHSLVSQTLAPFNAYANVKQLFTPVKNPNSMSVTTNLYKSLYCLSSVFTHVCTGVHLGPLRRRIAASAVLLASLDEPHKSMNYAMIAGTPSVVSINIVITSCFTAMKWIPIMQRQKVSLWTYAVAKIVRTLPAVAAYLVLIQTLPIITSGGPLVQHIQEYYADICYRNGWRELMFINNFAPVTQICLPIAWFMSADFQLYILFFPVLMMIASYPEHALRILVLAIAIGFITSGIVFTQTRITAVFSGRAKDLDEDIRDLAAKVYHTGNLIAPYAIGMLLGLKLMQHDGVPRPVGYMKTILILAGVAISWYFPWLMHDNDRRFRFGYVYEVIFSSVTRSLTAVAFAFMFYALFNSRHPIILWVSRSRFFVVMSRLSLSFFLMHVLILVITIAWHEDREVSLLLYAAEYLFIVIASVIPSVMLYAFVEVPFSKIYGSYKLQKILDENENIHVSNGDAQGQHQSDASSKKRE